MSASFPRISVLNVVLTGLLGTWPAADRRFISNQAVHIGHRTHGGRLVLVAFRGFKREPRKLPDVPLGDNPVAKGKMEFKLNPQLQSRL